MKDQFALEPVLTDDIEGLLGEAYQFTAWAMRGGQVLLQTPRGRILLAKKEQAGVVVIVAKWAPSAHPDHLYLAWVNVSTLANLGITLRAAQAKRVRYAEIYYGFSVAKLAAEANLAEHRDRNAICNDLRYFVSHRPVALLN